FIERKGCIERTNATFEDEDALRSAVNNLAQSVGREINERHPVLDARLPDGSRVHAIIPPGSRVGTCITIRKFSRDPLTLEDLMRFGSLTESTREFLEICVRLRKNVIIAGGSGTGKTSMLGALSRAIPETERIIVIEDTSELRLHQEHCLYLEAQPRTKLSTVHLDIRELFRSSLRMRPDRIIVGEVRGGEALDLIQSMISGHEGSLSTVHASSAIDALVRLETLSLMSDVEIPVYVARAQVASAIDVLVQLTRSNETGRRRIRSISEAGRLNKDNEYQIQPLYTLQPKPMTNGKSSDPAESGLKETSELVLTATGLTPTFNQEPHDNGMQGRIKHSSALWTSPER
ncbi:MAG: ATPase, T2SS/T4P/T4SS family, partial [Mariniblastus sp.]|nr:ATPase, T2SS/T4P/T4SS family [Mariniblastus sp.]